MRLVLTPKKISFLSTSLSFETRLAKPLQLFICLIYVTQGRIETVYYQFKLIILIYKKERRTSQNSM